MSLHYYPKGGVEQTSCSCAPTAGCFWQGHATINVPSFSLLFSLTHPILSDTALAALTAALKSSPFNFQGTQILPSPNKEAFNWVAVNYVLENFFKVRDNPAWGAQPSAEQLLLTNSHRDTVKVMLFKHGLATAPTALQRRRLYPAPDGGGHNQAEGQHLSYGLSQASSVHAVTITDVRLPGQHIQNSSVVEVEGTSGYHPVHFPC